MTLSSVTLFPLLLLVACAGAPPAASRASAPTRVLGGARGSVARARATVEPDAAPTAQAEPGAPGAGAPPRAANASSELALQARSDREQAEYQVAELCRANALYQQFLQRAGSDPGYQLAAQRSRQQIQDNQAIIAWLLPERGEQACP